MRERLSRSALERRVKRWLLREPFEVFLQVTPGLEATLLRELEELGLAGPGASVAEPGGVLLPLGLEGLMRTNLELRTVGRVLLRIASGIPAATPEMLFDQSRRLPWEVHLGFHENFALRMSSRQSKLQAGDHLAKTVAAAIGRRIRELGLTARLTPDAPITFHVRLQGDRCTFSLDTSGEHLHRRSVRTHVHTAPLRETLAAATVLEGLSAMSGRPDLVVDPFCGSGTLLLEAVDAIAGLPPGRRRRFALEQAAWYRPGRWREVRRRAGLDLSDGDPSGRGTGALGEADDAAVTRSPHPEVLLAEASESGSSPRFLGVDLDAGALHAARANLAHPDYAAVELRQGDSLTFDLDALGARRGLLVANLPYGVRLGERKAADHVTSSFLDRLAAGRTRWRVALLCADRRLVESRLYDPRTLETRNGGLRVWLVTGAIGQG